jgi:two-component system, OmpR family, sensor histidine kinase KdpD
MDYYVKFLIRFSGVLVLVAAVTALDYAVLHANSSTAGFSYLLLILFVAAQGELGAAIAASFVCVVCYDFFFLPPILHFTIGVMDDWIALGGFLTTAITASQLSARARRRAEEAGARRQEMEQVYEFSRAMMIGDDRRSVGSQIAQSIALVFRVPEVALYERAADVVYRGGPQTSLTDEQMRDAARTESAWSSLSQKTAILPVRLGGRVLGSLGLVGAMLSEAALQAVAQLGGIAIERARAQEAASHAEAARQNEQLKATLLDALAHEFKTPLTSIKAAITSLLTTPSRDATERELLTVADEEADRLTTLLTRTIEVARIEAGHVKLTRRPCSVRELIAEAMDQLKRFCEGRDVHVSVPEDLPPANADPGLIVLVLRLLLDNALKYSAPSASIAISAERLDDNIQVHVSNDGPGIDPKEMNAIFEKFYRGKDVRGRIPGTGLGLTIAREIIAAHGKELTLNSQPGAGVRFSFLLPIATLPVGPAPVAATETVEAG